MFNSIFYTDDGTLRLESLKKTINGIEYLYQYGPKPGESLLEISDSSGYIFAMIKKTNGTTIKIVREYNKPKDWIFASSDSEMLGWMIQRFPRVAEEMIWELDGK